MNTILIEKIRKEIENLAPRTGVEHIGTVMKAGDGIAEVEGLARVMMAEMVTFEDEHGKTLAESLDQEPIVGFVLNLEEEFVKIVIPRNPKIGKFLNIAV